jgi:hypothetical protein
MKREKRLTRKERRALDPGPKPHGHAHIHCIACGRHLDPEEFEAKPPEALYLRCDHGSRFPSCASCEVQARVLIAEHDRSGRQIAVAKAWH